MAPPAGHFAPQCGSLRGFAVYQKWGQKQAAGITFVVTMARNVYAKTEAECEKKLAELIWEMKAEIAAGKEQAKQQKPAS